MKFFVTGVGGQLGHDVMNELIGRGHEGVGSDIQESYGGVADGSAVTKAPYVALDITDRAAVERVITDVKPDAVIHCAAWTAVDLAEDPEKAEKVRAINVGGTQNIADACKKLGCKMTYISTDYVFDGQGNEPLNEFDTATPDTIFGKSKLAGENFVRELNPKHLIVRSSWVYAKEGSCFVNSVIRQAKEGGVIQVAAEQYSSPTSAKVLADFVMKMIDANEYGIYHASCEGCCSRVEAAEEILRCMGQDPTGRIEEISAEAGKNSPRRTDLQNLMMKVTGIYQMPDWKDAMRDYIQELRG